MAEIENHRNIDGEQVHLLYQHALVVVVATLVNSAILVFIQWQLISHAILIAWLTAIALVTGLRCVLVYWYRRTKAAASQMRRWKRGFIIGTAAAGIVWGASGIFLFPSNSISHQVFLVFVLGGMTAGAVVIYAPVMTAFIAFTLPK